MAKSDAGLTLTEDEIALLIFTLAKFDILSQIVKAGLPCTLTKKNFGMITRSDNEVSDLLFKLEKLAKIAWLKENR